MEVLLLIVFVSTLFLKLQVLVSLEFEEMNLLKYSQSAFLLPFMECYESLPHLSDPISCRNVINNRNYTAFSLSFSVLLYFFGSRMSNNYYSELENIYIYFDSNHNSSIYSITRIFIIFCSLIRPLDLQE